MTLSARRPGRRSPGRRAPFRFALLVSASAAVVATTGGPAQAKSAAVVPPEGYRVAATSVIAGFPNGQFLTAARYRGGRCAHLSLEGPGTAKQAVGDACGQVGGYYSDVAVAGRAGQIAYLDATTGAPTFWTSRRRTPIDVRGLTNPVEVVKITDGGLVVLRDGAGRTAFSRQWEEPELLWDHTDGSRSGQVVVADSGVGATELSGDSSRLVRRWPDGRVDELREGGTSSLVLNRWGDVAATRDKETADLWLADGTHRSGIDITGDVPVYGPEYFLDRYLMGLNSRRQLLVEVVDGEEEGDFYTHTGVLLDESGRPLPGGGERVSNLTEAGSFVSSGFTDIDSWQSLHRADGTWVTLPERPSDVLEDGTVVARSALVPTSVTYRTLKATSAVAIGDREPADKLAVGGPGGAVTLLRYQLPKMPAGRKVVGAALRLRTAAHGADSGSMTLMQVRPVTGVWSPASATLPAIAATSVGVVPAASYDTDVFVRLDPAALASSGTLDLAIVSPGGDDDLVLEAAPRLALTIGR